MHQVDYGRCELRGKKDPCELCLGEVVPSWHYDHVEKKEFDSLNESDTLKMPKGKQEKTK